MPIELVGHRSPTQMDTPTPARRKYMRCSLTIPARINLLGKPSDALEGDFATITAAIDLPAGATLEPADGLVLEYG